MLDFSDTRLAFQAKSDQELRHTFRLMRLIDSPFLTKVGPPILNAAFKINLPIQGLVKKTLYGQFCAGEDLEASTQTTQALFDYGVRTILDYAVEGEKTEAGFDATLKEMLATLRHGKTHEAVAFTACKLTGLGNVDLMAKKQTGNPLNEEEQAAFLRIKDRLHQMGKLAQELGTPFFIDAEESWIQDVIDAIAEELMAKYNQDRPIVYTTVQLYRHDRLEYLRGLMLRSREQGYVLGVKLVRGAYMEKEADRAEEKGYPNPIQPNKAATDRDYDAALRLCIEHLDRVAVCAGTHNESSSRYLAQLMRERGVSANHPHIWFAQLLGMSDHISFNLAHNGYNTAKYLPYGPVKAVMPYLIRRAEENTSIAGQASREVDLLTREVKRRRQSL
ncbi:MAG: proline dehydrogenase family protein [Bacteroidota bacterium]